MPPQIRKSLLIKKKYFPSHSTTIKNREEHWWFYSHYLEENKTWKRLEPNSGAIPFSIDTGLLIAFKMLRYLNFEFWENELWNDEQL